MRESSARISTRVGAVRNSCTVRSLAVAPTTNATAVPSHREFDYH